MSSEQQQQGAMEYAVLDTSKKKQKRNEQQNVSNLLRINNLLFSMYIISMVVLNSRLMLLLI